MLNLVSKITGLKLLDLKKAQHVDKNATKNMKFAIKLLE